MRPLSLVAPLLLAVSAQAQEPVAYVKTVTGASTVLTGTQSVKAEPGTGIFQGSQIRTGSGASLGITFKDNTVMAFGPNTELTVDEYLFNPNQGQLKLSSKLAKGTLNYVSGVIAKLRPEAVEVKVPTGVIGVRGTHFAIKVEE